MVHLNCSQIPLGTKTRSWYIETLTQVWSSQWPQTEFNDPPIKRLVTIAAQVALTTVCSESFGTVCKNCFIIINTKPARPINKKHTDKSAHYHEIGGICSDIWTVMDAMEKLPVHLCSEEMNHRFAWTFAPTLCNSAVSTSAMLLYRFNIKQHRLVWLGNVAGINIEVVL